jgi:pyruvate/2-oxoglutarate dehydrogenase complex dihydrolipoamide acyltransferase (E2) component
MDGVVEVRRGGRRRIDRVLGAGFSAGLCELGLAEVRARRDDAAQEETDLSYLRRLLHARIDLVRAEQRRRREGGTAPVVDDLARILAVNAVGPATGSGRHQTLQPSRAEAHRRHVEALVADVDLSDVSARTDDELEAAVAAYREEEHRISILRKQLQELMDASSAEVTRRYRQGEVDVSSVLPTDETLG